MITLLPRAPELHYFVLQALTIHRSTKSPSHNIKEISNIGFDTTEDDPAVLVAEVSSHGSHESNLEKSVLSQLSITCTRIEESATILFLYLQSVYFPDRDVLLGPDPRPLNTSNNTPIEGNWKSASFLTFNCPIHDCKCKCMGKNLQSRTLVWDFIYL